MRSERTRVPPVTDERSPPASRMTGADSPVTVAAPSTISPSVAISSFASATTRSPRRSANAEIRSSRVEPLTRRRAVVSVLVRRSASACALPRPSAIASAKFAKSTVNHSHAEIARSNEA
jgi:hypothetical protein